ncbi:hypothetical protein [Noviherbaspirillum massiliense]|uniref:hypothetical protein n=1 Tax=Noviherbaspirillum massiliense TaxID=1465823 RepID=UPI0002FFBA3A|nr:hypothetical protein [Noviherbaspirillum massiliense]
MTTLVIKDLIKHEELDHEAMIAIRGGIIGGCGYFYGGMTVQEAVETFVCRAGQASHSR